MVWKILVRFLILMSPDSFFCPKGKLILMRRDSKKVYSKLAKDEKESLIVLVNMSEDIYMQTNLLGIFLLLIYNI